ncbi:MAG TPA: sugar ABC transporter permease [Gaiellaceae bacterium]
MGAVAVAKPRGRRRVADLFEQRRFLAPALIAPAVLFIAALVGFPFVLAIYLSFTDASAGSLSGNWVGIHNFVQQWDNPIFRKALWNTALFTIVSQVIVLFSAGILAHALIKPFRGRWLMRFLIVLPWAAPISLGAISWLWIFDSLFSIVNWTLVHTHTVGVVCGVFNVSNCSATNPPQWLGDPTLAKVAIIAVHSWRIIPFATVIFIAGIASIPNEVHDAAAVDGATGLRKFWYVSLPLQLPIATVALLFGIVFTATDMTVTYILTHGGPFNSSHMITTWAFNVGIESGSLGEGAAVSLFMLPVLAFVAIGMLVFAKRAEVT